jgi:peptidoglycan/xylan/chitin deacetylase (PgdA/CDA1 family)
MLSRVGRVGQMGGSGGRVAAGLPTLGLVGQWDFSHPNIIPNAPAATSWTPYRATITEAGTAPGGIPAYLLKESTAVTNSHKMQVSVRLTQYRSYTASLLVKQKERAWIALNLAGSANYEYFDVANGVLGAYDTMRLRWPTMTAVSDGWYRCNLSFIWGGASGATTIEVHLATADKSNSYTGDGTSGLYVAGWSLNENTAGLLSDFSSVNTLTSSGTLTSVADLSGNSNTLTVNGTVTNEEADLVFDGSTAYLSGLPVKGAEWTILNCTESSCQAVDSAGGSYINGVAAAGATEFNVGVAGGYGARLSYRVQYSRVLTAPEQARAFSYAKTQIRKHRPYPFVSKPVLTINFDDGYATDYSKIWPMMQAKGVRGTSYIVTDWIGTATYMTAAQIQEMVAGGWDIGSHSKTHSHLTGASVAVQTLEWEASKAALEALGISVNNSAGPYGEGNSEIVRRNYRTFRSTDLGYNTAPLRSGGLNKQDISSNLATMKTVVDACKAGNSWALIYGHQMDDPTTTALGDLVDYAVSQGVSVLSVQQALDYLKNPLLP